MTENLENSVNYKRKTIITILPTQNSTPNILDTQNFSTHIKKHNLDCNIQAIV